MTKFLTMHMTWPMLPGMSFVGWKETSKVTDLWFMCIWLAAVHQAGQLFWLVGSLIQ